ncbi:MAG TPA: coproporphyrinogen-III oxidase family protein [Mesotoga sp.]|nr:coproporphyrinogen-III oxidase family protein [Mesotoga sp.]
MYAGVYLHLPFCARRCAYCDFCTLQLDETSLKKYHAALKSEIELFSDGAAVDTLYFGGGSPSLYPLDLLQELLDTLRSRFRFELREATLEANPWELTFERLERWKKLGVNRLSVGLQSSDGEILKTVNRPVPPDLFERLEMAVDLFDNVNFDFILGLPGENRKNVENNLKLIERLKPAHISYYMFDSDHETDLMASVKNDIIELPDKDTLEKLHDFIVLSLKELGLTRYEISSWSKGRMSLHNLKYWKSGDYKGFGVSAGSHEGTTRSVNCDSLDQYIDSIVAGKRPLAYIRENTPLEELFETLFMGLRLIDGLTLSAEIFPADLLERSVERIASVLGEFLVVNGYRLSLNDYGLDMSRLVFERLVGIMEEMESLLPARATVEKQKNT